MTDARNSGALPPYTPETHFDPETEEEAVDDAEHHDNGADVDDDEFKDCADDGTADDNEIPQHNRCLPEFQFSIIESEYDETLAFPDSVTILSTVGDKPVLVERKETDDDDDEFDDENSVLMRQEIPFTSIYGPSVKFNSFQRKVFIPGREIHVRIVDTERSVTTHLLNPNLYTIELTHGPFKWTIKRRYKHFNSLHQQLSFFRTSLNIPFPSRAHKEKRTTLKAAASQMADESTLKDLPAHTKVKHSNTNNNNNGSADGAGAVARIISPTHSSILSSFTPRRSQRKRKKKKRKLPRFPNRPESLITVEHLPVRIKQLEDYLYNLLNISLYRYHHDTLNFVEVSNVSFVSGLGLKGKEGEILKRTGSTRPGQAGCNFFGCFQRNCCVRCNYFCSEVVCGTWRNRWFFVKETCFGYVRPTDGSIRAVILFDQGFDVSTGIYQTGMRKGLQVLTNSRHIVLKCWTKRKCKEWMQYLKNTAHSYARDFTCPNPNMSYAPMRANTQAVWYVDGAQYMAAVADGLEAATEEIFIADWWLSPEIYMKRPALDGDYWRLDKILLRKAKQGVKVFVLLYKEVEMALGINSYYSKQTLAKHENIKVMRHPDHARGGILLWAHHEKIVVIDQAYAFIGGIDLCYGRWDDREHRLTDLGSISTASVSGSTRRTPSGQFNKDEVDSAFGSRKSSRNAHYETLTKEPKGSQSNPESSEPNTSTGTGMDLRTLKPGDRLLIPQMLSSASSEQTIDTPALEGMKLNTPEMERKNVLDRLKNNAMKGARKGKDFMQKFTSDNTTVEKDQEQEQDPEEAGVYSNNDSFQTDLLNDISCTPADLSEAIKLSSEPDRNKLNIFKKISKQKTQNTVNSGKKLFENVSNNSPLISLPSGTTITPAPALAATENITISPHNLNMSIRNISTYESFGGLSGTPSTTKNIMDIDLNKPKKRGRKPGGKNQARPKLFTSTSFQSPKKIKSTKLNGAAFSYTPDSVTNKNPLQFPLVPIEPLNLSSVDQYKDTQLTHNIRLISNICVESAKGELNSENLKLQKAKEKKERKKARAKNSLEQDNGNVEVASILERNRDLKNNLGFMDLEKIAKSSTLTKELTLNESAGIIYKNMLMQSADCSSNQINEYVSGSGPSNYSNSTNLYASTQPNMLPMLPLLHFPPRPGLIPSGLGIFPPTTLTGFSKKVIGNASSNMILPHSFVPISNACQSTTIGHRPSHIEKDADNITQSGLLPHTDSHLERSYCNVAPLVPEFMKLPTALTDTNKTRSPDPNGYEVKQSNNGNGKEFVQNSHISTFIPVAQGVGDNALVNQSLKSTKTIKFSPPATGNLGDPIEVSDDSNDDELEASKTTHFGSYPSLNGLKSSIIQSSNLSTSGLQQNEKSHPNLINANSLQSPNSECKHFKKDVKALLKMNESESNPLQSLDASPHPSQFNINFMSNDKFSLAGGADLIPLSRVDSGLAYSSLTVPATSLAAGATSGSMPSNAAFQAEDQHFLPNFVGSVNYDDITITPTNNLSITELKLRKLHKKIKKPKEGKIKKKKDKKDKTKNKDKSEENIALNIEKTKNQDKKLKKDKKKEKQVTPEGIPFLQGNVMGSLHKAKNLLPGVVEVDNAGGLSSIKSQAQSTHQIVSPKFGLSPNQVPKLTLKLSGKSPPSASSFEGDHDSTITESKALTPTQTKKEHSPELAQFSPLVTGPPKPKPCETHTMNQQTSPPTCSSVLPSICQTQTMSLFGVQPTGSNASSSAWIQSSATAASATLSASSVLLPQQLMQPPKQIQKMPALSPSTSVPTVAPSLQFKTEGPQTVPPACAELNRPSSYVDAEGYRIWICPACGKVDDGSAMIGCDGCDAWYHWTCVGIHVAPNDNEDWFCRVCVSKKKVSVLDKKKKRHNKKK